MKKNYTHLTILIDRSGSMLTIKKQVIEGFNNLIKEQRAVNGDFTVSLIQFDSYPELSLETSNDFSNLDNVVYLDEDNYQPRGVTPLNDALGVVIKETGDKLAKMKEQDRPERVIFVCITDGQENCSMTYETKQIKEMIEHQEKVYNWKFIYIGANQDSFSEGGSRGFTSNMNYSANVTGSYAMYSSLSKTISKARSVDVQSFSLMDYSSELSNEYDQELSKASPNT